jgi:hypothetical protein
MANPDRPPRICESCHGSGGNWDCGGENAPENCTCEPDDCNCGGCDCESCTGNPGCPECEEGDAVRQQIRDQAQDHG